MSNGGTIVVQHTTAIYILPIRVWYNDFPLCTVWNNNAAFRDTESLQGLFYRLFIFSWTVAPATNTGMLGSGYTVALRHLYKDCFSLNCEKLLLVRGEKSFPRAELKRAHRVPRWPSLCECWAVEVLKKCQVSYEFKWWMFFIISSTRIKTKYLQSSRKRLVSIPSNCRFCMVSFDIWAQQIQLYILAYETSLCDI